jgi:hypothetical protein
VNIELTAAGRDFVIAGFLGHHQVEAAWMQGLSEAERRQLAHLLRKALANPPS